MDSPERVVSTRRLEEEVRLLTREISFKYVSEPSIEEIRSDLIIGLKRYNQSVRSKARQRERDDPTKVTIITPDGDNPADKLTGLGTNLRPSGGCGLDDNSPVSKDVEAYLFEVQRELLDHIDQMAARDTRKPVKITQQINSLLSKLKQRDDMVVVPTDKTNSVILMEVSKYRTEVRSLLAKEAVVSSYAHLQDTHKKALDKLETIKPILSESEFNYVKSTITKRAIPTVQLLVKDHKKKNEHGDFPTRLVVPAKNFTAGFPHVGQRGIKEILDRNKINYMKKTIVQALDLKQKLEALNITRSDYTIATIDAKNMYPSVKFGHIEKAVSFFLRNASDDDKKKAGKCLDMVKFGMANTLITFEDQYYEYGGKVEVDYKGLTIGGFESAFFADLVAAYILENTTACFDNSAFNGIYRDVRIIPNQSKSTHRL